VQQTVGGGGTAVEVPAHSTQALPLENHPGDHLTFPWPQCIESVQQSREIVADRFGFGFLPTTASLELLRIQQHWPPVRAHRLQLLPLLWLKAKHLHQLLIAGLALMVSHHLAAVALKF
jgi:hypothetical protein